MDKNIADLICQKDEKIAKDAAFQLVTSKNTNDFEKLCEKMDFVFDFIKNNVYKRLSFAINKDNFKNILPFFKIYSPHFDDFFASILAKYADEDLTDEVLNRLETGTKEEKTYFANYFKKIPDTIAQNELIKNLDTDFEPLFINCAMALGKMQDEQTFNKYITLLNSNDEFEKLKAVKFLVAYNDTKVIDKLLNTMLTSSMSENIAGEIVTLVPPFELFNINFEKGALLFNEIINGLGEILPLENFLYYEIPYITEFLLENLDKKESVILLFNLKNKLELLTQNDEYIFDLDKNTKNEILNLKNLLNKQTFWNDKKNVLKEFLEENNPFINIVLEVVRNEDIKDFAPLIAKLTTSKNETLVCEAVYTLKKLQKLELVNQADIKLQNENLKAILERHFA